jgi:hypothetical protein
MDFFITSLSAILDARCRIAARGKICLICGGYTTENCCRYRRADRRESWRAKAAPRAEWRPYGPPSPRPGRRD